MPLNRITYNGFTFPFARLNVTETPVYADDRITQIGIDYVFEVSGVVSAETHEAFQVDMYTMRTKLRPARHSLAIQWSSGWHELDEQSTRSTGAAPEQATRMRGVHNRASCNCPTSPGVWRRSTPGRAGPSARSASRRRAIRRTRPATSWRSPGDTSTRSDCDGLTTRTVSGKLICTVRGAPADSHRDLVVPILPTNFERTSQSFEQSEDRRELSFSITDTEAGLDQAQADHQRTGHVRNSHPAPGCNGDLHVGGEIRGAGEHLQAGNRRCDR